MNRLVLVRLQALADRTLGSLTVYNVATSICPLSSLELPWRNNERNRSCIPCATYKITPEISARLGWVLRVHDVKDRDGVLIHSANYPTQIEGCIAAAMTLTDINGDSIPDANRSRLAMAQLQKLITGPTTLTVVEAF